MPTRETVKLSPSVVERLRRACARRTARDGDRWTHSQLVDEALLALDIEGEELDRQRADEALAASLTTPRT